MQSNTREGRTYFSPPKFCLLEAGDRLKIPPVGRHAPKVTLLVSRAIRFCCVVLRAVLWLVGNVNVPQGGSHPRAQ